MMAIGDGIHPDRNARVLAGCIAASIVLHAAVFMLWPGLKQGSNVTRAVQVISATLSTRSGASLPVLPIQPIQPIQPVQPEKPEVKKPDPVRPRPESAPRQSMLSAPPEAATPAAVQPNPASSTAPAAPVAVPPPGPAVPASPAQPRMADPAPSATPPTPAVAAQPEAPDAGSLEQYRLALISAARRYRRYPAQAMERGWQGKVEIRLQIGSDGRIKSASVKASSGYAILDQQALDMITKGKTLAQIPAALRGKDFIVDVPVIFDLQAG